ncbi:MAG TPA: hypothetical protein VN229_21145 [Terriglobales bacterium]|nr:hypothetical protein [Terriglobales bacterium]
MVGPWTNSGLLRMLTRSKLHPDHISPPLRIMCSIFAVSLLLAGCDSPSPPTTAAAQPTASTSYPSDPELGPFSVHLLSNSHEIEVSGDMNSGVTQAVRTLLDATPGVQVVHLNSPGGIAHEGYLLSRLIKERHLATYTATLCASACTEAFLGGSPRYLAKDGKLGFHSASRSLGGTSWDVVNDALRRFYKEAGLPDAFIERALNTPPNDIWFPTNEELRAAHVVDEVVDRSKFAASGASSQLSDKEVDIALNGKPLFAAISAHDPANYTKIHDLYVKGTQAGRSVSDITDEVNKLVLDKLLPAYAAKAPDEPILKYFAVQVRELQYLNDKNPDTCAAEAFPQLGIAAPSLAATLPHTLQDDEMAALAEIVNAAFTGPYEPTGAEKSAEVMQTYARKLTESAPDALKVIQHPQAHRSEPAKLCNAMLTALQLVTTLPTTDAAAVNRHILMSHG